METCNHCSDQNITCQNKATSELSGRWKVFGSSGREFREELTDIEGCPIKQLIDRCAKLDTLPVNEMELAVPHLISALFRTFKRRSNSVPIELIQQAQESVLMIDKAS